MSEKIFLWVGIVNGIISWCLQNKACPVDLWAAWALKAPTNPPHPTPLSQKSACNHSWPSSYESADGKPRDAEVWLYVYWKQFVCRNTRPGQTHAGQWLTVQLKDWDPPQKDFDVECVTASAFVKQFMLWIPAFFPTCGLSLSYIQDSLRTE